VNNQLAFEENQKYLCGVLTQTPENSQLCIKAAKLGEAVESRVQMLVPISHLQDLAENIHNLLSTSYSELTQLKKQYYTSKNEADVWIVKYANIDPAKAPESLHAQLLRITEEYILCENKLKELFEKVMVKQDNTILAKVRGLEGMKGASNEHADVVTNDKSSH